MRHLIKPAAIALFLAFFALSATPATPAPAQEKSDRITAMDLFSVQTAGDPQISPDGSKIVYVRSFADAQSDRRYSNLWIINFDGSDDRALTSGNYGDNSPLWSPDGTRLAYISDRDGKPQLYVRWMDSGQTARITNLENSPESVAWAPDGKQFSFAAMIPESTPKIAALPSPPEGAKWADPPRAYDRLFYRFNGAGYIKPGYTQLFIVSADGGAPRQLTSGNFEFGGLFSNSTPQWTPDGKYLLFSSNLRPDYEYDPLNSEVYEVSVADGTIKQLTNRKGPDEDPVISPDGKTIAYAGFDDRYQGHQTTYMYLMNRDGSNPRVVTSKLDRDVSDLKWAPDGSGVYLTYDSEGDTKLAFYLLDGSTKILAEHFGGPNSNFSVARNGNFAFSTTTPTDPGDIAVSTLRAPKTNVITALNKQLFTQKKLGSLEEIWFNSSLDKRKIEGWIMKPADFDPSKKYPLILEIHGGPFSDYGDRFDLNDQMMSARGYVILRTNPRGSTSYGEEFANLIHHAYPGDDFYDLNSGVDAIIAKGYIDTDNLFVTGGSGGGVLTCWMIDHTTRFRAAASLYPVINWYSWVLTSDLPSFGTLYWFPGMPWDNTEQYMKRSVISYVKAVKTPTLLMTGEEDYRTPISEAEQFYAALKLLKIETTLVRFPGEPHGLSRRPSHQIAKVLYVLGWFDSHRAKP